MPNEVVFLHETIGILIIFSLIFLHCGFFEPPPIVIIFFGREYCPAISHKKELCPICSKYGRKDMK